MQYCAILSLSILSQRTQTKSLILLIWKSADVEYNLVNKGKYFSVLKIKVDEDDL